MKSKIFKLNFIEKSVLFFSKSRLHMLQGYLLLSWLYAFCSQIIIYIPFNFVPISLQPLPLFLFSLLIGRHAVYAYLLTLLQTAFGAPFFSGFQGGIIKLIGPTGGYIIGFAFASIFLVLSKNYKEKSFFVVFVKLLFANLILYICGLLQLSLYIENSKLLSIGLYPFLIGEVLKILSISLFIYKFKK